MFNIYSLLLATAVVASQVAATAEVTVLEPEYAIQERDGTLYIIDSYNLNKTYTNKIIIQEDGVTITCLDCRTWGNAYVASSDVNTNDTLYEQILLDVEEFFEDPIMFLDDLYDFTVEIALDGVGGYFSLDVKANESTIQAFTIFATPGMTPTTMNSEIGVGVGIEIDIVVTLSAEVDITTGFEFSFPGDGYLAVDPLKGEVTSSSFKGGSIDYLPTELVHGDVKLEAALRVKSYIGANVSVFDIDTYFGMGAWINLIDYKAEVESSQECHLNMTESVNLNMGAFFAYGFEEGSIDYGKSPSAITTVLSATLPGYSSCGATSAAVTSGAASTTAAASTTKTTSHTHTLQALSTQHTSIVYVANSTTSLPHTTPTQTTSFTAAYTQIDITTASTVAGASASALGLNANIVSSTTLGSSTSTSTGAGPRATAVGSIFGFAAVAGFGLLAVM